MACPVEPGKTHCRNRALVRVQTRAVPDVIAVIAGIDVVAVVATSAVTAAIAVMVARLWSTPLSLPFPSRRDHGTSRKKQ